MLSELPDGEQQPLIINLAIFIDRWQMAVDLWPNTGKGKHQPRGLCAKADRASKC